MCGCWTILMLLVIWYIFGAGFGVIPDVESSSVALTPSAGIYLFSADSLIRFGIIFAV